MQKGCVFIPRAVIISSLAARCTACLVRKAFCPRIISFHFCRHKSSKEAEDLFSRESQAFVFQHLVFQVRYRQVGKPRTGMRLVVIYPCLRVSGWVGCLSPRLSAPASEPRCRPLPAPRLQSLPEPQHSQLCQPPADKQGGNGKIKPGETNK